MIKAGERFLIHSYYVSNYVDVLALSDEYEWEGDKCVDILFDNGDEACTVYNEVDKRWELPDGVI